MNSYKIIISQNLNSGPSHDGPQYSDVVALLLSSKPASNCALT